MKSALGIVAALTLALVLVAVAFLGYGSLQAANFLQASLRVGAPTAQGSGWPAPEGPTDIGFVGDPMSAFGYEFESVRLGSELGDLPAWVVLPAQGTGDLSRWAIFVHGIGGRRENGYRFVSVLREAGYHVVLISYRNDEDAPLSTEGLYAFGLTEWRDLEAAVEHALDSGAEKTVLVAESMGGAIAGQFLRRSSLAGSIDAIVLDAPALDFPALVAAQIDREGVPFAGLIARGGFMVFNYRSGLDFAQAFTIPEFASFNGPLFLSHGARDRIVPVSGSDYLVEQRSGPTEYLRTDADHILSWKADPEVFDAALAAFLAALDPD